MSLTMWRAAIEVSRAVMGTAAYTTVPETTTGEQTCGRDMGSVGVLRSIHRLCFLVCLTFEMPIAAE
jgi:hypothetical protein